MWKIFHISTLLVYVRKKLGLMKEERYTRKLIKDFYRRIFHNNISDAEIKVSKLQKEGEKYPYYQIVANRSGLRILGLELLNRSCYPTGKNNEKNIIVKVTTMDDLCLELELLDENENVESCTKRSRKEIVLDIIWIVIINIVVLPILYHGIVGTYRMLLG